MLHAGGAAGNRRAPSSDRAIRSLRLRLPVRIDLLDALGDSVRLRLLAGLELLKRPDIDVSAVARKYNDSNQMKVH